jgi:hypothetical protein
MPTVLLGTDQHTDSVARLLQGATTVKYACSKGLMVQYALSKVLMAQYACYNLLTGKVRLLQSNGSTYSTPAPRYICRVQQSPPVA